MSKLTHPIYDHMTTSFVAREEIDKVAIEDIDRLCRLAWEQKASKKAHPQAAKISAVKPVPKESSFQGQQDKGEGPARKRGRCRGKKKQAAKSAEADQDTMSGQEEDSQLACSIFTPPRPILIRLLLHPLTAPPPLPPLITPPSATPSALLTGLGFLPP